MPNVNPVLRDRWRSRLHVGPARPTQVVKVQRGLIDRDYDDYTHLDGSKPEFGFISGSKHNDRPWQGFWRATGDWLIVPNVSSVELSEQFDTEGMAEPTTATIEIQNVVYQEINGIGGIFHRIKRGFLAPWRGFTARGRKADPNADVNTDWYDVLNGGYRIRVEQGYGDATEPEFDGLIDDCDTQSSPDTITVTARSFGLMFTDSRLFGSNKAKEIGSPVVFADRAGAEKKEKVGNNADASSTDPGHSYQNVLREGSGLYWLSDGHTTPDNTEWVEVHLPKGRYSEFYVAPEYAGMEMYLSVYLHSKGLGGKSQIDGVDTDDGWVTAGLGNVPGAHGGFPYVKHWKTVNDGGLVRKLPFTMIVGDGTALRVSFRKLGKSPGKGDYRAKVSRLLGLRQKVDEKTLRIKHWILVDDMADLARWVFMWAGFHEWEVKNFGYSLKEPATFHQGDYLIDVLKYVVSQGDYLCYVDKPSSDPDSIGVPRLVPNAALDTASGSIQEVRDTDLVTGVQTKFSKEALAYIIRVRGAASKKGTPLGEDSEKRIQAVYFPPWSGAHHSLLSGRYDADYPFPGRLAGVRKHVTWNDPGIDNYEDALGFAVLIAVAMALAAYRGTIEVPGYPYLRLNEQVSVVDTASGVNTRMWIAGRHSTFTRGEDGAVEWKMTLDGAMIDTPDVQAVLDDKATAEYRRTK